MSKKLKLVAISLTILIALTQLWDWYQEATTDLIVEANYGNYLIPPLIKQQIDSLKTKKKIQENIDFDNFLYTVDDENKDRLKKRIISEIHYYIDFNLPDEIEPNKNLYPKGLWSFNFKNEINSTLKDIRITFPNMLFASIINENGEAKSFKINNVLKIGDFQHNESKKVFIWTQNPPTIYDKNSIKITYSSGVADLKVYSPTSPVWNWVSRHEFLVLFLIPFFIILLSWVIISSLNLDTNQEK